MRLKTSSLLTLVVISTLITLLLLPWVMGVIFKKNYHELISFYNLQDNLSVKIVAYQRHWFSSHITLDIEMQNGLAHKIHFTVSQEVIHGPFTWNSQTRHWQCSIAIINSDIYASASNKFIVIPFVANTPIIKITDILAFDQTYSREIESTGFSLIEPRTKLKLLVNSIHSNMLINPKLRSIQGFTAMKNFAFVLAQHRLYLSNINLAYNEKQRSNGLWVGEQKLMIAALDFENAIFNDLKGTSNTQLQNNKLTSEKKLSVAKINYHSQTMGPLQINISLKNINGNNLATLLLALKKDLADGMTYREFLREKLPSLLPKLIYNDTQFSIDKISFISPSDNVDLTAILSWANKPSTIPELIMATQFDASIQLSQSLTDTLLLNLALLVDPEDKKANLSTQLKVLLTKMVEQGYINEQNNNYFSHVILSRGRVKANDRDFFTTKLN